tara:strand:+ start:3455 stop:3937 length:483 start_codon:yes stop_codon:yes gene_type:complete
MGHFYFKNNTLGFPDLFDILYQESIKAYELGETPVAALLYDPKKKLVVSKAHNLNRKKFDPCAHAEILAIQKACKKLKVSRLDSYDLFSTLEPCLMCSSIILQSKIRRVYFSCEEKKMGALINNHKLALSKNNRKKISVYYGFSESRFSKLIQSFFKEKR